MNRDCSQKVGTDVEFVLLLESNAPNTYKRSAMKKKLLEKVIIIIIIIIIIVTYFE